MQERLWDARAAPGYNWAPNRCPESSNWATDIPSWNWTGHKQGLCCRLSNPRYQKWLPTVFKHLEGKCFSQRWNNAIKIIPSVQGERNQRFENIAGKGVESKWVIEDRTWTNELEEAGNLYTTLADLEQYTRKNSLEIHGIPDDCYSTMEEVVLNWQVC